MPPALFFLFEIALAVQYFVIPYKYQDFFSVSMKNDTGISILIELNLQMALGNMDIQQY